MNNYKFIQEAYTFVLRFFIQRGHAPHYLDLASHFELEPETARQLLWDTAEAGSRTAGGCWMSQDTDYIEAWAPFSNLPTHHLITIDGQQKWYGQ